LHVCPELQGSILIELCPVGLAGSKQMDVYLIVRIVDIVLDEAVVPSYLVEPVASTTTCPLQTSQGFAMKRYERVTCREPISA